MLKKLKVQVIKNNLNFDVFPKMFILKCPY